VVHPLFPSYIVPVLGRIWSENLLTWFLVSHGGSSSDDYGECVWMHFGNDQQGLFWVPRAPSRILYTSSCY
jgi:hypothetical protein